MVTRLDLAFLEIRDPRYLVVTDVSTYAEPPSLPEIGILPPGLTDYLLFQAVAGGTIRFDSQVLGMSAAAAPLIDLSDGLYTVRYRIVPKERLFTEQSVFRTQQLERQYAGLLLQTHYDLDCHTPTCLSDRDLETLRGVRLAIEGIRACAAVCEFKKATALYGKAQRVLALLDKKARPHTVCADC